MATYYSNITLFGPSQQQVKAYVEGAGRKAFVSPTVNGGTVVYDSKCDEEMDPKLTASLAADLSKALSCMALAVINRHNYVFIYQLYENGKVIDEYFSEHDLFEFDLLTSYQVAGDVKAICSAFDKHELAPMVAKILNGDYESEHVRHHELVRTLGLPECAVSIGFMAISGGELPCGIQPHEIECTNC